MFNDYTAHFMRTDLLNAGIFFDPRKVTSYAVTCEVRVMKLLIEDGDRRRKTVKKKKLEAAQKRISGLSAVFKRTSVSQSCWSTMLWEFVEKIVVYKCSYDGNKTRRQDIEVYYSFVSKMDLPK